MPTSKRRWLARVADVTLAGAAGWWAWRSLQPDERVRFRRTIGAMA